MRYLLGQFITHQDVADYAPFHRLYGLLPERGGIIGNYRIEGRVHMPIFSWMMNRNITAGESAGNEKLRGGDGALQTIRIGIYVSGAGHSPDGISRPCATSHSRSVP